MGIIRKSLFVGTGGFVSPNSKKQRQANKQIRLQKQMLKTMQQLPVVVAAPTAEPKEVETGLTDLVIERVDLRRKVETIKIVREATGLPLAQAKRIVETHEAIECADDGEAAELRAALEHVGAVIALRGQEDEAAGGRPGSRVGELERLARLHRDGDLTDAEFATAKRQLLGG
jgi:ribosomal protein L7/L12